VVVADGPTSDLLGDAGLMTSHRLELPYGFDPRTVGPHGLPHAAR
jgi:cobalt/nickel transport system ATP-binding protein